MQLALSEKQNFVVPWKDAAVMAFSVLLNNSYKHWMGEPLVLDPNADHSPEMVAQALYEAPFPLIAYGTQPDPLVRYANHTAQSLWRRDWHEFVGIHSRLMAEPVAAIQEERNGLLEAGLRKGFVKGYSGRRVSMRGERFEIVDTVLWNVTDEAGARFGQGCRINNWWYV